LRGAIIIAAVCASAGLRAYTLTITPPVGIASVAPPLAKLALTPLSGSDLVAAFAPGTKLLLGELTIATGVTQVY
jgi:hypothetical protein